MTTSIRDLLDQIVQLQLLHQAARADPQAATDARLAIGAAGVLLGKLDVWRPDWTTRHKSWRLSNQLAACQLVEASNDPQATSRSRALMAATADAVGSLCGPAAAAADRWAITIAVADIVRHSTTAYAANGPALPDPQVAQARTTAIAVARAGLILPPQELHRGLIDLPIPGPPNLIPDPLLRAVTAAAEIDHLLARAVADENPGHVSVYELRAIALAFQHRPAHRSNARQTVRARALAGHISDWVGRKTVFVPALLVDVASAIVFLLVPSLPGLLIARVVSGISIGLTTATATAYLTELHIRAVGAEAARVGRRAQLVAIAPTSVASASAP